MAAGELWDSFRELWSVLERPVAVGSCPSQVRSLGGQAQSKLWQLFDADNEGQVDERKWGRVSSSDAFLDTLGC